MERGRNFFVAHSTVRVAVFPFPFLLFYFFNRPRCPMERGRNYLVAHSIVRFAVFPFPLFFLLFFFIVLDVRWGGAGTFLLRTQLSAWQFSFSPFIFSIVLFLQWSGAEIILVPAQLSAWQFFFSFIFSVVSIVEKWFV